MKVLIVFLLGIVLIALTIGCGSSSSPRVIKPPTNLVASRISGDKAVLSWEASADSDVAGYCIYRGLTTEAASFTQAGTTLFISLTYTNTGLTSTDGYYYAVSTLTTDSQEGPWTDAIYLPPYSASLPITIKNIGGQK